MNIKLAREDLLARVAEVERAKADRINELIAEQQAIPEEAARRLAAIKAELKALGWHPTRPRKNANGASGASTGANKGA